MPFMKLSDLKETEPVPGYRLRVVHGDNITIAYWSINAGSSLPAHSHPHEQIVNMIEGEFELVVDGNPLRIRPGDIVTIRGGVPHAGTAITDCRIIDVFYPLRIDYR